MAESAHEPLTPRDCNLRGLPFMPLDTERLLDSDMMALSTGEELKTALRLWCKSWNQEPAASLPDDDRILAHLAGKDLPAWRKVKGMALRGFVKCSDGRLYHPVIAEKAIEAMRRREEHQAAKEGDNDRKREEREDRKLLFAALREIGVILPAKGTTTSHLREVAASRGITLTVTAGHKGVTVTSAGSHKESHREVTAKTGTGTGIYKKEEATAASDAGEGAPVDNSPPPSEALWLAAQEERADGYAKLLNSWEKARGKHAKFLKTDARLIAWERLGVTRAELSEAYHLAVGDRQKGKDDSPVNAGFVDVFLAKVRAVGGAASGVDAARPAGKAADLHAWALTASGLETKGAELGVVQQPGENFPDFKTRVHAGAGLTDADRSRLLADYGVRV